MEGIMSLPTPETGRITLTLSTETIEQLRLLALLRRETQNEVAEALLVAGGLGSAVEAALEARKPVPGPVAGPQGIPAEPERSDTPKTLLLRTLAAEPTAPAMAPAATSREEILEPEY